MWVQCFLFQKKETIERTWICFLILAFDIGLYFVVVCGFISGKVFIHFYARIYFLFYANVRLKQVLFNMWFSHKGPDNYISGLCSHQFNYSKILKNSIFSNLNLKIKQISVSVKHNNSLRQCNIIARFFFIRRFSVTYLVSLSVCVLR